MKPLLLVLLTLLLFTGCSDDKDSNESNTADKTYWKVISRQKFQFQKNGDDITSNTTSSAVSVDTVYLQVQGDDMTLFTVASDSTYTKSITSIVMVDGPYFRVTDNSVLDASFASGNSEYVSFSGVVPIHIRGISFLFHKTSTSGDLGTIEIESIDTELPSVNWTPSDKDLFVDWKTFFRF